MILVILGFVLGVANFAMHKAVVESGHPFVEDSKFYFGRHFGKQSSYILEFVILLGVMGFTANGSWIAPAVYLIYTGLNALSAWLLLTGRI
jgi:purine-cytosine permease-like protein